MTVPESMRFIDVIVIEQVVDGGDFHYEARSTNGRTLFTSETFAGLSSAMREVAKLLDDLLHDPTVTIVRKTAQKIDTPQKK